MKVCNRIKKLIDEADQPDAFSFEVSNHLSDCAGCKSFASERAALRSLLVLGERVSVPSNFNAALNARIAEVKTKKAFSWFSASSFMRLGTATAAVAVMVFVAQYGNLFSNGRQVAQPQAPNADLSKTFPADTQKPVVVTPQERDVNNLAKVVPIRVSQTQRDYQRRATRIATARVATDDYPSIEGGVVLVRGPNGEREVPVPTISVGAQPLLYVNAGRGSQPARSVATSF